MPSSRSATICLWMYSIAPTSRPRVGWTATSRSGSLSISRAMMAFCWLPPDMLRAIGDGTLAAAHVVLLDEALGIVRDSAFVDEAVVLELRLPVALQYHVVAPTV